MTSDFRQPPAKIGDSFCRPTKELIAEESACKNEKLKLKK